MNVGHRPELARADHLLTASELREKYGNEHPRWRRDLWLAANPNAGSDATYWKWVEAQAEEERNEF